MQRSVFSERLKAGGGINIRAANVSLPSPPFLGGEGLGVRGERSLGSARVSDPADAADRRSPERHVGREVQATLGEPFGRRMCGVGDPRTAERRGAKGDTLKA